MWLKVVHKSHLSISRTSVVVCVAGLFIGFFTWVLFYGYAFLFRDAAHFYYPLFNLIQDEWTAGRIPLWNTYENSGTPLLGNPTSSVFYPFKLIFFLPFTFSANYKIYILFHVLLAVTNTYVMVRTRGASVIAAGAAGISYGFSAVILFQHANVVFLCGACWIPLALLFTDQTLRERKRISFLGIGIVLALQVMSGDPQTAYLCSLLAVLYLIYLKWRPRQPSTDPIRDGHFWNNLQTLVLSVILAVLLSAVQILPSLEFSQRSSRVTYHEPRNVFELSRDLMETGKLNTKGLVGSGSRTPHQIYEFSTGPWRWLELIWPNINGRQFPLNARWIQSLHDETTIWTPSLYMGLFPLLLVLTTWKLRNKEAWQTWLRWILVFGLAGSLGRFGVVWLVRRALQPDFLGIEGQTDSIGNEVGGLYWLMTVLLPGFVSFRYPSKLLVFTAIGISGLTAIAWDELLSQKTRPFSRILWIVFIVSAIAAGSVLIGKDTLLAHFESDPIQQRAADAYYGPLQAYEAWKDILKALAHTLVLSGAILVILRVATQLHRTRYTLPSVQTGLGITLLIVLSVDLLFANRWMIVTGSQSLHESVPKALEVIHRKEEVSNPQKAPYRIFRTLFYSPLAWEHSAAVDRPQTGMLWERDTLQGKYGLAHDVSYTLTGGTMEMHAYEFFLAPWYEPPRQPRMVYYPQLGFDIWNTKYFVLPWHRVDKQGRSLDLMEHRGIVSFLYDQRGNPLPRLFPSNEIEEKEAAEKDYQILHNPDFFPRAWIVHRLHMIPPLSQQDKQGLQSVMQSILRDRAYDLRHEALVETSDSTSLLSYQASPDPHSIERCDITQYEPQFVEITAELDNPGMIILADVFYPGWKAYVDDQPSDILRVNRVMRGVALSKGKHRIVFRYDPHSFRWGAFLSAFSWTIVMIWICVYFGKRLFAKNTAGRTPVQRGPQS